MNDRDALETTAAAGDEMVEACTTLKETFLRLGNYSARGNWELIAIRTDGMSRIRRAAVKRIISVLSWLSCEQPLAATTAPKGWDFVEGGTSSH